MNTVQCMSFKDITTKLLEHFNDQAPMELLENVKVCCCCLAAKCNFRAKLDDALCDCFVCDLISDSINKRLLPEAELDFAKAVCSIKRGCCQKRIYRLCQGSLVREHLKQHITRHRHC